MYSRVIRTPFACMDLDAKLCYDRIMVPFGMLCSQYFGMPKTAYILHGTMLAEMKHHVKTALGISSAFFQSTPEQVLYGSGQGSSGSPPLWITISIILFWTLEAQMGIRVTYSCLRKHLTTTLLKHLSTTAQTLSMEAKKLNQLQKLNWAISCAHKTKHGKEF
jgi:hypothetical protein